MRVTALVLVVTLAFAAAAAAADPPSISRDARGAQPAGDYEPPGAPPTPRVYVLSQTTIFVAGVTLLVVAAALGVYTLLLARRTPTPR